MHKLQTRLSAAGGLLLAGCLALSVAHADSCLGAPTCVDSGVFATDVTGVNSSWDTHHRVHFVRVNFRVRNTSTRPLMLGFRWRSSASLVDNFGNAYAIDWKFRDRIVGIGILSGEGADASFVVQPGSSRTASLVFSHWPGKGSVGDTFNADFSVEQLEPIPGNNSVRTVATHALSFQGLHAGEAINGLDTLMKAFKK